MASVFALPAATSKAYRVALRISPPIVELTSAMRGSEGKEGVIGVSSLLVKGEKDSCMMLSSGPWPIGTGVRVFCEVLLAERC